MTQALWDAVVAAPEDHEAHAVLADHLEEVGDPRGRCIQLALLCLQDQARWSPELERWRFEHRDRLRGPFADWDRPLLWREPLGLCTELQLTVQLWGTLEAEALEAATPLLGAVRRLRLMGSANYDAVLAWVLRARPPLQVLELGPLNPIAGTTSVPLQQVLDALPELRSLVYVASQRPSTLRHARLERVLVHEGTLTRADVSGVPQLKRLVLLSDQPVVGAASDLVVSRKPPGSSAERDPLLTPALQTHVRRFELDGRFWTVVREGAVLLASSGKQGGKARQTTTRLRSPYEASQAYWEKLQAKRAQGWTEVWAG